MSAQNGLVQRLWSYCNVLRDDGLEVAHERAFSGELVPQDPADEPAEALLARIRADKDKTKGQQRAK